MKGKVLNILLVLTSLIGYLEWGKDSNTFLFQAEAEIASKLFTNPLSVLHPFTLLPLIGQILLIITFFQNKPSKKLTYIGMGCIGLLFLFMFAIGLMSLKFKILFSTLPFIVVVLQTIRHLKYSY